MHKIINVFNFTKFHEPLHRLHTISKHPLVGDIAQVEWQGN